MMNSRKMQIGLAATGLILALAVYSTRQSKEAPAGHGIPLPTGPHKAASNRNVFPAKSRLPQKSLQPSQNRASLNHTPSWPTAAANVEWARNRLIAKQRETARARQSDLKPKTGGTQATAQNAAPSGLATGPETIPPVIVPFHPDNPLLPATLPAVLAVLPEGAGINPLEQAASDELAEAFFNSIARDNPDPMDLDYQNRWRRAQVTADDLFRTRFGDYAWMVRHNAVHRQALAGKTAP